METLKSPKPAHDRADEELRRVLPRRGDHRRPRRHDDRHDHILPTGGAARSTGGLWVGKFLETVTFQERDTAASDMIGEICGRHCPIENVASNARSWAVGVEKYRDAPCLRADAA